MVTDGCKKWLQMDVKNGDGRMYKMVTDGCKKQAGVKSDLGDLIM